MKKINTKQKPFLHLAVAVALSLILLSITVRKADCSSTGGALAGVRCNATRISDCLADDEEFPMESETSRRILQGGKVIGNRPLSPARPFCNGNVYDNCFPDGRNSKRRPCNYRNTCNRPA